MPAVQVTLASGDEQQPDAGADQRAAAGAASSGPGAAGSPAAPGRSASATAATVSAAVAASTGHGREQEASPASPPATSSAVDRVPAAPDQHACRRST